MMLNKQKQEGGDGSTNYQAEQMHLTLINGIDEKRAREIYQEMSLQQRAHYTNEALIKTKSRLESFENSLMQKMELVDGALEAFADPSFQLLLVEAQKTAASTEREADHDLLSELLIHRFQKGEDRKSRAGINRAVEIVDKIDDDALLGLTLFHAIACIYPLSGDIHLGLDALDNLFEKLLYRELPIDNDWIDHLDILDCIRIHPMLRQSYDVGTHYAQALSGYTDIGIKKDSENYKIASNLLLKNNIPSIILIEHAINKDYVRLQIPNREAITNISLTQGQWYIVQKPITEKQIQCLNQIYDMYEENTTLKENNIKNFLIEWEKRTSLKKISSWISNIEISFQLTAVGKILAHSNAQRCDNTLPPFN